jgi:16S rRNA (uracil1498-N3)-methyltransferase
MRKIFVDFPISGSFLLSEADSRHILVVLRHNIGDRFMVTDSQGDTYECVLTGQERQQAVLEPIERICQAGSHHHDVVLAAGLLKSDKFEWVIQKSVELGVTAILPIQMKHCVVKLNQSRWLEKKKRWQRIALEAAKQCGRDDVPVIGDILDFTDLVKDYGSYHFIIPYERETAPLQEVCAQTRHEDVVICIGPEGGFAPAEITYLSHTLPWNRTVSLGPRILRAETAAIAAVSIIMYERGFTL